MGEGSVSGCGERFSKANVISTQLVLQKRHLINPNFKCSAAKHSCFPLTSALPFFIPHISYPSTSASVPKETKDLFWHSNTANNSGFLGKDRGGRVQQNKLLCGLERSTCASVSPAKSCRYLLPIHSDLCENGAGSEPWCCWRGLHRASMSASSLRGGMEVKSLPSALEGMPEGGGALLRNCAMLVLVPSILGTKRGKRKRKKTLQLIEKLSSGSYRHSICSECWLQQNALTRYLPKEQTMLQNFTAKTTVRSNPKIRYLIPRDTCPKEENKK